MQNLSSVRSCSDDTAESGVRDPEAFGEGFFGIVFWRRCNRVTFNACAKDRAWGLRLKVQGA